MQWRSQQRVKINAYWPEVTGSAACVDGDTRRSCASLVLYHFQ